MKKEIRYNRTVFHLRSRGTWAVTTGKTIRTHLFPSFLYRILCYNAICNRKRYLYYSSPMSHTQHWMPRTPMDEEALFGLSGLRVRSTIGEISSNCSIEEYINTYTSPLTRTRIGPIMSRSIRAWGSKHANILNRHFQPLIIYNTKANAFTFSRWFGPRQIGVGGLVHVGGEMNKRIQIFYQGSLEEQISPLIFRADLRMKERAGSTITQTTRDHWKRSNAWKSIMTRYEVVRISIWWKRKDNWTESMHNVRLLPAPK